MFCDLQSARSHKELSDFSLMCDVKAEGKEVKPGDSEKKFKDINHDYSSCGSFL